MFMQDITAVREIRIENVSQVMQGTEILGYTRRLRIRTWDNGEITITCYGSESDLGIVEEAK